MPKRSAELRERCTAAHDWDANCVMFWRPMKASTVLARDSMHVLRREDDVSVAFVSELLRFRRMGRHSSDVMYDLWR